MKKVSTNNTKEINFPLAEFKAHFKQGRKYVIVPKVTFISGNRDIIFNINVRALSKSKALFLGGPFNNEFIFRLKVVEKQLNSTIEPIVQKQEIIHMPYFVYVNPHSYNLNNSQIEGDVEVSFHFPKPQLRPPIVYKPYFHFVEPSIYNILQTPVQGDLQIQIMTEKEITKILAEPNFMAILTFDIAPDLGDNGFTLAIEKSVTSDEDLVTVYKMAEEMKECRKLVGTIDKNNIYELIAYKKPPDAVYNITRAVLTLLGQGELKKWETEVRRSLKDNFLKRVKEYDPTSEQPEQRFVAARTFSQGLDYDICLKKGSLPTAIMFSFVQVALRLRLMAQDLRKKVKEET